ncbi:MAG: NADH:flavin oxidoreductase [Erysipelotrichaceae bacterium]
MKQVLSELKTKKITFKNRIVMPPMATSKASELGFVSPEILKYYDNKSKDGNLALIIIEHCYICKNAQATKDQMSIMSDEYLPGLKKLADTIHNNNTKAVVQINHAGLSAKEKIIKETIVGPSMTCRPGQSEIGRELSIDEIEEIKEAFTEASIRVKLAGFDGVEIHGAHGYLLSQFLSPITNKRVDQYGGSLANRMRLHLEITQKIRKAVGDDFPIYFRLGACDFMPGGLNIAESIEVAKALEQAGVDVLDISGGFNGYNGKGLTKAGYFKILSKPIKEVVSIPVILTGGIKDLAAAEELIVSQDTDLVGIGRALLSDDHWLKKQIKKFQ